MGNKKNIDREQEKERAVRHRTELETKRKQQKIDNLNSEIHFESFMHENGFL